MKNFALQLYKQMMAEMARCQSGSFPPLEEVETCYRIALGSWEKLKEKLSAYCFASRAEEIEFFKTCKPLFITEIEYFNLVYHSQLFKPADPVDLVVFWEREGRRIAKFREDNREFLAFYQSGDTTRDEEYFLRATNQAASPGQIIYDIQGSVSTARDYVISSFRALEKYTAYVNNQLARIKEQQQ